MVGLYCMSMSYCFCCFFASDFCFWACRICAWCNINKSIMRRYHLFFFFGQGAKTETTIPLNPSPNEAIQSIETFSKNGLSVPCLPSSEVLPLRPFPSCCHSDRPDRQYEMDLVVWTICQRLGLDFQISLIGLVNFVFTNQLRPT